MIQINMSECPTCHWTPIPPTNVRMAKAPQERDALEARYKEAVETAKSKGASLQLGEMEELLAGAHVVVNMDASLLKKLLTGSKELYNSYQMQVAAGTLKISNHQDDHIRLAVEAKLYGSNGDKIIYAALSPDGTGLKSYGDCVVTLREVAIAHRASLLEENSYHFMENHDVGVMKKSLPLGYRSVWEERIKLGVAKLASGLHPGISNQEVNKLILKSEGDRATEEFIEVHIWERFDNRAISKIVGPNPSKAKKSKGLLSAYRGRGEKAWNRISECLSKSSYRGVPRARSSIKAAIGRDWRQTGMRDGGNAMPVNCGMSLR
jgi:hypothetical protein